MHTSNLMISAIYSNLYTIVLAFVLVLASRGDIVKAESNSSYEYDVSGGEVTITKYIGKAVHVDIPNKIDNLPVTALDYKAFDSCSVKTVRIPDSVRTLGTYTFSNCDELTGVIIGDGVTQITSQIFNDCDNLRYIIFGKNLCSTDKPIYYSGYKSSLEYISYNNDELLFYQDEWDYGTFTWEYSNRDGNYEICCRPDTETYELFNAFGFPIETEEYVNVSFVNGEKTLFTASMVKTGTDLNDLYSLEGTSSKAFCGWYTSADKQVDKVGTSDITVYAKYETIPKAPIVKVLKTADNSIKFHGIRKTDSIIRLS